MSASPIRVLLTNDDGPPGPESPYIYGLWRHLTRDLGWNVKVVVPSSQKSWIGKAYQIKDTINGRYYYPKDPDGTGEISEESRPLLEAETGEWILLDGTPATCVNIALHNLYHGEIDLVISGPNLGRNTSSAFCLSSGTLGAALSSSLSLVRSIALSYGTMSVSVDASYHAPAHALSARIIASLLSPGGWGTDPTGLRGTNEVDLYSINVPMIPALLVPGGVRVCTTRIWRNSYGRLFAAQAADAPVCDAHRRPEAGPDAPHARPTAGQNEAKPEEVGGLVFKWAPDMKGLIKPLLDNIPADTDAYAIHSDFVSVTPIRASFAEPPWDAADGEQNFWQVQP